MHPKTALTLFALTLAAPAGAQHSLQTGAALQAATGVSRGIAFERTAVTYDDKGDELWARGRSYKAGFGAFGATYIPFLGSHAPQNYPLHLRLTGVTVGGESLGFLDAPTPARHGDSVTLERDSVREVYHLGLEHIEQTFVFDALQGAGDLVVTMTVDTPLAGEGGADGLAFAGPFGGVRYGLATVLDADGDAAPAPLEYHGGSLSIRVPQSFLAYADFPVTIDPIINTYGVGSWAADLLKPDTAADPTGHAHMTVYEEQFSQNDSDALAIWRDSNGNTNTTGLATHQIDQSPADWRTPRIAASENEGSYVVVASVQQQGSNQYDIYARSMTNTTMGPELLVSGSNFFNVDAVTPDIGGCKGPNSRLMVIWSRQFQATTHTIQGCPINFLGSPLSNPQNISAGSGEFNINPRIADSASRVGGFSRIWPVVWEKFTTGAHVIYCNRVDETATTQVQDFSVSATVFSTSGVPEVSSLTDGGIGNQMYAITYETSTLANPDINVALRVYRGNDFVDSTLLYPAGDAGLKQTRPSVCTDGSRFIYAYTQEEHSTDHEVYIGTINAAGGDLCESEDPIRVDTSGIDARVAVAASADAGGLERRAYFANEHTPHLSNQVEIRGGTYLAPLQLCGGESYCPQPVANSTGFPARLAALGPFVAGGNLELAVENMPLGQFGYFLASRNPGFSTNPGNALGTLCLSSPIARFTGQVVNAGATGSVAATIDTGAIPMSPTVAALPGESWFFQGWYRDGSASRFTDAVRIDY